MIIGLSVENFKGIRERVEVELAPITLLFGSNSAGKSTIADALDYFEALLTARSPSTAALEARSFEFGNKELKFSRLVHGHDLEKVIKLELKCGLDLGDHAFFSQASPGSCDSNEEWLAPTSQELNCIDDLQSVGLEVSIRSRHTHIDGGLVSSAEFAGFQIAFNDEFLAEVAPAKDEVGKMPSAIWRVNTEHSALPDDLGQRGEIQFRVYHHELMPRDYDPPLAAGFYRAETNQQEIPNPGLATYLNAFVVGAFRVALARLRKRRTISGIRTIPNASFLPLPALDRKRWIDGVAAWDFLAYCGEDALIDVNNALGSEGIGSGYQLRQQKLVDFHAMTKTADPESIVERHFSLQQSAIRRVGFVEGDNMFADSLPMLWPSEVGTGLSQVVPVITACCSHPSHLNIISQPELHLHPRLQCELADVFVSSIKGNDPNSFILETHSEHLILRFLRRIRETERKLAPKAESFERMS